MMKNIFKKVGVALIFLASACSLDGDLVNPNAIQPSAGDPDLVANAVVLNFATFFNSVQGNAGQLVRHNAMTGGFLYQTAILPTSLDFLWTSAYQSVLNNTKLLVELAGPKNLTTHVGIAKVLEAYTYIALVDVFGNVPQSAALKGTDGASGFNPAEDDGASVYDRAIALLEEARVELTKTGAAAGAALPGAIDIYYAGNRARWVTLANTIELKAQVNLSMIASRKAAADARINSLLTANNLIDATDGSEDFTFKWASVTVPDSRHPLYNQYYGPGAGQAGGYIANYFMNELFQGRGVQDPRWRYYFYRQVGSIVPTSAGFDPRALGCAPGAVPPHYAAVGAVFCVFEPGFYGRDHGDGSGTPPDGPVLTAAGIYPAGGRPDNTPIANSVYNVPTQRGQGADGRGISPIWMHPYTDYLKAEILARNGNPAAARTQLVTAINNSIQSVKTFADGRGQSVTTSGWSATAWNIAAGTPTAFNNLVNNYRNATTTAYDGAGNKLDVIGREFYVALWGNGYEAYNLYRRTSAPRGMQPTVQVDGGVWFRSLVYPSVHANLNGNAVQKDPTAVNRVFWDTNPDVLR